MKTETPKMDWQQVALNGGPPCFAQLEDEDGYYCGRAERWEGHDGEHKFVSLDDFLNAERERAAKIAETRPESRFDYDHEPALTEQQIRNGIAAAIRGSKQ